MFQKKEILDPQAFEQLETRVRSLLSRTNPEIVAPLGFSTRVLSEVRLRKQSGYSFRHWRRLAIGSTATSFALILILLFQFSRNSGPVTFLARVQEPVAVHVELTGLKTSEIAQVEVDLPAGVHFFSKRYPEIEKRTQISLAWNAGGAKDNFPFVIQGVESGVKQLKIRFLDSNHKLVAEKLVKVTFEDKS